MKRLLVAIAAPVLFATPVAALTCKPQLTVPGPALPDRAEAIAAAIAAWSPAAVGRHGRAYGAWENAAQAPVKCFEGQGSGGAALWVCQARARPCKP